VFYWPDACFDIHGVAIEPALMSRLPVQPENPSATALVAKARGWAAGIRRRCGRCAGYEAQSYRAEQRDCPRRQNAHVGLPRSIGSIATPRGAGSMAVQSRTCMTDRS